MLKSKENDWLFNVLANPQMDVNAFEEVGLDATNTSLEDEENYLTVDKIVNDRRFQTNGVFDKEKFHTEYEKIQQQYNILARDTYTNQLSTYVDYYKDDIFAPKLKPEQEAIRQSPETQLMFISNPQRTIYSSLYLGSQVASPLSQAERGQTNPILQNAKDVDFERADFSKAVWGPSVNEISLFSNPKAYFSNFGKALVLSTWETDGEHIDPLSGQTVKHAKGDIRYNQNGEPFYEYLDGRDVYGKKVLSKFDYLTVDGTSINKYDFFDSDDKRKSTTGTIVREAVSLVPLLVPGVNSIYLGLRIALQAGQMFGTLDKMLVDVGNESSYTVNEALGLFDSLKFSTSEYSQAKTLTWENVLTMAGDVALQLSEQRWLFRNVARIRAKGKDITDQKVLETIAKERQARYLSSSLQEGKSLEDAMAISFKRGMEDAKDLAKAAHLYGEELSRLYMTGITVMDAYGEAKEAGASDLGAAALTLGYALGEYGILRSDIGKWILPEVRAEKMHLRDMVRTLMTSGQPMPENAVDKYIKDGIIKKLIRIGKSIAHADYAGVKSKGIAETLQIVGANALGEGVEETTEELLYDAVKSIGNLVSYAVDSDVDFKPFDNWIARYGMSFAGGFLGGAMAQADPSFIKARFQRGNITYDQAIQELVWMIGEGREQELLRVIDRMPVNNQFLTSLDPARLEDVLGNKQGTEIENMDIASKKMLRQTIGFFKDILHAHGADISEDNILKKNTQLYKDLKAQALGNSAAAASFLQGFNTARAELLAAEINLANLTTPGRDTYVDNQKGEYTEDNANLIETAKEAVKTKAEKVQSYLNGEQAPKLIRKIMKEMHSEYMNYHLNVNKASVAYALYKMPYKELSPEQQADVDERWKAYKDTGFKDDLDFYDEFSHALAKLIAPILTDTDNKYFKENPDTEKLDDFLQEMSDTWKILSDPQQLRDILEGLEPMPQFDYGKEFQKGANEVLGLQDGTLSPQNKFILTVLKPQYEDFKAAMIRDYYDRGGAPLTPEQEKGLITQEWIDYFTQTQIWANVANFIQPYITQGFVHPELRNQLVKFFDTYGDGMNNVQKDLIKQFKELPSVPILQIMEKFSIAIGNTPILTISDLMQKVEELMSAPVLDQIVVSKDIETAIQNALQVINLFDAQLIGASTDYVSAGNLWGINATVNELERLYKMPEAERSNLAEIRSDVAARIRADIQPIVNKLLFLKRITELNTQSKADAQPRIAVRSYKLFYDKFKHSVFDKKLAGHLRDDDIWNKNDALVKLNEALSKIHLLEEPINTLYSEDQYVEIEKERILFEDALYEYFNTILPASADNFDVYFQELFEDLDFFDPEDQKLDTGTTELSDAHFVHWLIGTTGIRTSEFLSEYNKNDMEKIAFVPVQELPIRLSYTMLMNSDYVEKCLRSFKALAADKMSKETRYNNRLDYVKEFPKDSAIVPKFFRTTLIEGVAGSGKTRAVLRILMQMVKNNAKAKDALLSHVFVASIGERQAKTLNAALGLDNSKFFDREKLLKLITGGSYDISKLKVDQRAGLINYGDDFVMGENGTFEIPFSIPDLDPAILPSLIVIDEIGRYTTVELDMLDAFAKKYGISVIVAGDLDQSKTSAQGRCPKTSEGVIKVNAALARGNFYHSPKLGYSFRTDNNLKQYNQTLVEDNLKMLYDLPYDNSGPIAAALEQLSLNPQKYLHLKYHFDDSGFYGDRVEVAKSSKELDPETISAIQKMFETFDMGTKSKPKKIGYIQANKYDEKNASPLEKYLKTATFVRNGTTYNCRDYIEEFAGMEAQGEEAQYYIVEPNKFAIGLATAEFWRQLYTGLTRASQGSIIYINDDAANLLFEPEGVPPVQFIDSVKVDYVIKDPFNDAVIKQITDTRKDQLTKAISSGTNAPQFKPSTQVKPATTAARSVVLASSTNDYQVPEEPDGRNRKTEIPVKTAADDFDMIAYSHMTHSTGYYKDASGLWTPPPNTAKRIDGLNGLAKIFNWDILEDKNDANLLKYMNIVDKLRELGLYEKNYDEFLAKATSLLGIPVGEIRMGYVKVGEGGSVSKDSRETLLNIHGNTNNADSNRTTELPNAVLSIFFFQDDRPVLEIPLLALPNFGTTGRSSVMNNLPAIKAIAQKYPGASRSTALKFREELLKLPDGTPGKEQFLNIVNLYLTHPGTRIFGRPGVLPAQHMNASGPFIQPYVKGKGGKGSYEVEGFDNAVTNVKQTGQTVKVPVSEYQRDFGVMVSNPMVSMSGNIVIGDKSFRFVKAGKPFVLVTDRMDITTEDKLMTEFENQIKDIAQAIYDKYVGLSEEEQRAFKEKYAVNDVFDLITHYYDENFIEGRRIKVVYVVSPEHNIEDYLRQLVDIYERQQIPKGDIIGNDFTAIKVYNTLFNNLKLTGHIGERYKRFIEVERRMRQAQEDNKTKEYWEAYEELGKLIKAGDFELSKAIRRLIIDQFTERTPEGEIQIKEVVLQKLVQQWHSKLSEDDAIIYINPLKDLSEPKGIHLYLRHVSLGADPYTVNGDIQSAVMWGDLNFLLNDILTSNQPIINAAVETGPAAPPIRKTTTPPIVDLNFLNKTNKDFKDIITTELASYTGDKSLLTLEVLQREYLLGANGLPRRILVIANNKVAFLSNTIENETTISCLAEASSISVRGHKVSINDIEGVALFSGEYKEGEPLVLQYNLPPEVNGLETIDLNAEVEIPDVEAEEGSNLENFLANNEVFDIFYGGAFTNEQVKEAFKQYIGHVEELDEIITWLQDNCADDENAKPIIDFIQNVVKPVVSMSVETKDTHSPCRIISIIPYKKL